MKSECDVTAFQVKRTIPLANFQPETRKHALQSLETHKWLCDVRFDGQSLRVSYDASGVNFRDIERLLDEANLKRPSSFWWRLKAAWYRYLDSNARSNALSRGGACCSRPPSPWKGSNSPDSGS